MPYQNVKTSYILYIYVKITDVLAVNKCCVKSVIFRELPCNYKDYINNIVSFNVKYFMDLRHEKSPQRISIILLAFYINILNQATSKRLHCK